MAGPCELALWHILSNLLITPNHPENVWTATDIEFLTKNCFEIKAPVSLTFALLCQEYDQPSPAVKLTSWVLFLSYWPKKYFEDHFTVSYTLDRIVSKPKSKFLLFWSYQLKAIWTMQFTVSFTLDTVGNRCQLRLKIWTSFVLSVFLIQMFLDYSS